MLNLGRIGQAVLHGICVFLVVYILGLVIVHLGYGDIGSLLEKFAPVLGLLAGLVSYFTGNHSL